ncbi:hypothetical protein FB567DRAFT_352456 [Paraphoma chrysanthemicola]|uniref:C2H2-type domain-containing protein n=1 Tax=Paraphoma chrysanthemicola TaxID=798071 RepID=A0A8K0R969_9PLEO|nr:hypothetical protein FB567DRAFT_352456 [Paraphoma chrysanthemicola]
MGINRCPICYNTFSRTDHLKRHLLTHSDIRRFACRTCSKSFNRRDAFRRHNTTCTPRTKHEANLSRRAVSQALTQGSVHFEERDELEKHSDPSPELPWDHMIYQLLDPYWESIHGGASQSLSLFVRTVSRLELHWIFDPEFILPTSPLLSARRSLHAQGSQVPTFGLPSSITMMDADDATASYIFPWSPGSYNVDHDSARNETIDLTQYTSTSSEAWTPSPDPSIRCDEYSTVSNNIISRLRNEICRKRSGRAIYPHEWSAQAASECYALFGPDSLARFTDAYWSSWYIHCPVIHKATFQVSAESATLISSLVLLAASYSSNADTRELARYWADIVEEVVYTDEYFGSASLYSALNAACLERRLRVLQAGLAVCVYQTFEGSSIARRRARRTRFGEIVDMGRELGFQNSQHTDLHKVTQDTFCWKEFILKEELIRTLTYTIVLDSSSCVMFNTVPKVMVEELQTDLFCPEACFQASTESECLNHVLAWVSNPLFKRRRISIVGALKILSESELDSETLQIFVQIGSANLYLLAAALHLTIFYIRNSIHPLDPNSAVLNIMRNWRKVWTLRDVITPGVTSQEERWRQPGFMKDALQFWLLGQVMLESKRSRSLQTGSNSLDQDPPIRFDQPCMTYLKQYLDKFDKAKR